MHYKIIDLHNIQKSLEDLGVDLTKDIRSQVADISRSKFAERFGPKTPKSEGGDNEPIKKLRGPITEKKEEPKKSEFDDILKFYGARFATGGDVNEADVEAGLATETMSDFTSNMTGDPAQFTGCVDTVTDFSQFDNDNNDNNNEDIDSQYVTGKEFNVTPENKPGLLDYTKDEFRNQGLFSKGKTAYGLYTDPVTTSIGLLYSGYRAKKAAEKKAEPTLPTGEDGIGEGDYKSTVADWAESRGLTKDYSAEDNERQQEIDKAAFDAGFRTQDAKTMNINNDGDNNNPPTIINDNETYASVISPFRVVNTQGTGLPDPSNFLYTYVGSKQNILDLYNNVQNVLYKPQTNNGLLAVSDSPYYDFLKTRNLDRRIL